MLYTNLTKADEILSRTHKQICSQSTNKELYNLAQQYSLQAASYAILATNPETAKSARANISKLSEIFTALSMDCLARVDAQKDKQYR